ncbi:MAG: carboxypeptidase regulatory-like domain-containing protein [Planctomycetes bacterium]|nr:carboxypeptidase regulatory-like domain-containing protein [Planctomycetota bacterium]
MAIASTMMMMTSTATEMDGTQVLAALPTGDYRVVFSVTGFGDVEFSNVPVTAGETVGGVDAVLAA